MEERMTWVRCPGCGDRLPVDYPGGVLTYNAVGGWCGEHEYDGEPLD